MKPAGDPQKSDLRVVFCRGYYRICKVTFSLLMVIIGYVGSGRAADLVPSGRVICADGGFCTSRERALKIRPVQE